MSCLSGALSSCLSLGLSALVALCLAVPSASAGGRTGEPARQTRAVGAFSEVEFSGAGSLQILVGAETSVVVQAGAGVIDEVRTEVRGDRLYVHCEDLARCGRVHVAIETPRLRAIESKGSANTRVHGRIEEGFFLAATHGSGRIHIDSLDVDELEAEIAGSGRLEAAGRADRLRFYSAGSGKLHLARLASHDATVRIAGSGDAALRVEKSLDARIAGTGSIELSGNPERIDLRTHGSGRLTRR